MMRTLFETSETPSLSLPECHRCLLYKDCASPKIPPSGSGESKILVVGEAPGKDEDAQGEPFVGKAGQYLRRTMSPFCDLDDCTVTNSIICRPPKNVMDELYLRSCRPVLHGLLAEKRFNGIITLGEWALRQVIPDEWARHGAGMAKWRGWSVPLVKYGAWLCPTFHPSFVLRTEGNAMIEGAFKTDLKRAVEKCNFAPSGFESIGDMRAMTEAVTDEGDAISRLEAMASRGGGTLAFDYETTGLKPEADGHRIVSCSFCVDGGVSWACMVTKPVLEAMAPILFSREFEKVASNAKFEERWTRKTYGRGVENWAWDTMLAAHCLDNRRGICSIKFQAFVRLGAGGWQDAVAGYLTAKTANARNRIDKAPERELLVYNAFDSLLEYRVMIDQRREMGLG